jgi:hypothetical protein
LRPDVIEVVSTVLDGLESSLSKYHEIGRFILFVFMWAYNNFDYLTNSASGLAAIGSPNPSPLSKGKPPGFTKAVDQPKGSIDVERSPSPWSDMSDNGNNSSSSGTCGGEDDDTPKTINAASMDLDIYYESRVYIEANLEILIQIHTAIKRSGLKFRNRRADEALKQADEAYKNQKSEFGERSDIQDQNGDHERFRRYLTTRVLWNQHTQSLLQTMNFRIVQLVKNFKPEDKHCAERLLEEKKLLVIFRAYFHDPARLTTVQRRLINANAIRRNRLIYAGNANKNSFQIKKGNQDQAVPPRSQPQPPLEASGEPTKGDMEAVKGFVAQPATAVDSRFSITGALAPPRMAKFVATNISARVQYLDYPKCPVKDGQFPCPYCSTMLSEEYTKRKKWR